MFKRIRKICLYKGCNKKSTHFGICGRRSNGLCDEHYEEWQRTIDRLEELTNELINSLNDSSKSEIKG
ncbi:MAG: hypothetical protein Q4F83_10990 [Eubacteriales bacterium]|nr:hypothetical protein [Eubacteriales bacterium]